MWLWLGPFSFGAVRSVGSGVGMSRWRTSSLLCALEKEGYGRLDLDSRNEAVPARLAASRPGIEDRRGAALWEVEEVEERAVDSSGSVSLVDVREVVLP